MIVRSVFPLLGDEVGAENESRGGFRSKAPYPTRTGRPPPAGRSALGGSRRTLGPLPIPQCPAHKRDALPHSIDGGIGGIILYTYT